MKQRYRPVLAKYRVGIKEALRLGYVEIGEGRNRICFDMLSGQVLKIPLRPEGETDNWLEAYRYNEYPVNRAECHSIEFAGLPCLIMEKLETIAFLKRLASPLPDWTNCVDCQQVGLSADGQIKAYDYGD